MYEKLTLEEIRALKTELRKASTAVGEATITAKNIIQKKVEVPEFVRTVQRKLYPLFLLIQRELAELINDIREEMQS